MEKLATIILNRNLPLVTNTLFNTIKKYNKKYTDIFVVEAGSKKKIYQKFPHGIQTGQKQERRA